MRDMSAKSQSLASSPLPSGTCTLVPCQLCSSFSTMPTLTPCRVIQLHCKLYHIRAVLHPRAASAHALNSAGATPKLSHDTSCCLIVIAAGSELESAIQWACHVQEELLFVDWPQLLSQVRTMLGACSWTVVHVHHCASLPSASCVLCHVPCIASTSFELKLPLTLWGEVVTTG
jgi:hypothetical protein